MNSQAKHCESLDSQISWGNDAFTSHLKWEYPKLWTTSNYFKINIKAAFYLFRLEPDHTELPFSAVENTKFQQTLTSTQLVHGLMADFASLSVLIHTQDFPKSQGFRRGAGLLANTTNKSILDNSSCPLLKIASSQIYMTVPSRSTWMLSICQENSKQQFLAKLMAFSWFSGTFRKLLLKVYIFVIKNVVVTSQIASYKSWFLEQISSPLNWNVKSNTLWPFCMSKPSSE